MAEVYHISEELAEGMMFHYLRSFEDDHEYPASVAPSIPQDAKAQLGTVDKLAQSVIPRLVDKLNEANWRIQRLEHICKICVDVISAVKPMEGRLEALETQLAKKQTRSRKKKETAPKEPEVDITEIADYDPDTDTWGPITIDGQKITGALIDVVEHMGPGASQMYSDELIQFIANLEPQVKKAIAERFPQ